MRLSTRVRIALAITAIVAFATAFLALRVARALAMNEKAAWALAMLAIVPVVLWFARWAVRNVTGMLQALDDGLRAYRDADFSMRLASAGNDETAAVKRLYNEVADVLRAQRAD